jgi:hypothetical protein
VEEHHPLYVLFMGQGPPKKMLGFFLSKLRECRLYQIYKRNFQKYKGNIRYEAFSLYEMENNF